MVQAQRAAQRLLDTEAAAAADALGSTSSNGVHSEHGLLEILSREVYDLSLVGMWRVHRMCKAPQGLSSWGLDLLLDQVSQARHDMPGSTYASTGMMPQTRPLLPACRDIMSSACLQQCPRPARFAKRQHMLTLAFRYL